MATDPYILDPSEVYTLNFSGGRSSGYMLHHILEANGGLPEKVRVVFCNTGKERDETLDFVQRCSEEWNVKVLWVEYRYYGKRRGGRKDPRHDYEVVDYTSASRNGEPFEQLIRAKRMLPTAVRRTCTAELKVRTVERLMLRRSYLPKTAWKSILGIRYDEPKRWQKALMEECRTVYPMVHAKVSKADVLEWWSRQPFDLGISSDWGNCDLCFLKGKAKLRALIAAEPHRAEWWSRMEREVEPHIAARGMLNKKFGQFALGHTYADLLKPEPQMDLPGIETEADCFCGD